FILPNYISSYREVKAINKEVSDKGVEGKVKIDKDGSFKGEGNVEDGILIPAEKVNPFLVANNNGEEGNGEKRGILKGLLRRRAPPEPESKSELPKSELYDLTFLPFDKAKNIIPTINSQDKLYKVNGNGESQTQPKYVLFVSDGNGREIHFGIGSNGRGEIEVGVDKVTLGVQLGSYNYEKGILEKISGKPYSEKIEVLAKEINERSSEIKTAKDNEGEWIALAKQQVAEKYFLKILSDKDLIEIGLKGKVKIGAVEIQVANLKESTIGEISQRSKSVKRDFVGGYDKEVNNRNYEEIYKIEEKIRIRLKVGINVEKKLLRSYKNEISNKINELNNKNEKLTFLRERLSFFEENPLIKSSLENLRKQLRNDYRKELTDKFKETEEFKEGKLTEEDIEKLTEWIVDYPLIVPTIEFYGKNKDFYLKFFNCELKSEDFRHLKVVESEKGIKLQIKDDAKDETLKEFVDAFNNGEVKQVFQEVISVLKEKMEGFRLDSEAESSNEKSFNKNNLPLILPALRGESVLIEGQTGEGKSEIVTLFIAECYKKMGLDTHIVILGNTANNAKAAARAAAKNFGYELKEGYKEEKDGILLWERNDGSRIIWFNTEGMLGRNREEGPYSELKNIKEKDIIYTDIKSTQSLNQIFDSKNAKTYEKVSSTSLVIIDEIHQVAQAPSLIMGYNGRNLDTKLWDIKTVEEMKKFFESVKGERSWFEFRKDVEDGKVEGIRADDGIAFATPKLAKGYKEKVLKGKRELTFQERALLNAFCDAIVMKKDEPQGYGIKAEGGKLRVAPVHGEKVEFEMHWSLEPVAIARWIMACEFAKEGVRAEKIKETVKAKKIKDLSFSVKEIMKMITVSPESCRVDSVEIIKDFHGQKIFFTATPGRAVYLAEIFGVKFSEKEINLAALINKYTKIVEGYNEIIGVKDIESAKKKVVEKVVEERKDYDSIILLPLARLGGDVTEGLAKEIAETTGKQKVYIKRGTEFEEWEKENEGWESKEKDVSKEIIKGKLEKGEEKIVVLFDKEGLTGFNLDFGGREKIKGNPLYVTLADRYSSLTDVVHTKGRNRGGFDEILIYIGKEKSKGEIISSFKNREELEDALALYQTLENTLRQGLVNYLISIERLASSAEEKDKTNEMRKKLDTSTKPDDKITDREREKLIPSLKRSILSLIEKFEEATKDSEGLNREQKGELSKIKGELEKLKSEINEKGGLKLEGTGQGLARKIAEEIGWPNLDFISIVRLIELGYSQKELEKREISMHFSYKNPSEVGVEILKTSQAKTPLELKEEMISGVKDSGWSENVAEEVTAGIFAIMKEAGLIKPRWRSYPRALGAYFNGGIQGLYKKEDEERIGFKRGASLSSNLALFEGAEFTEEGKQFLEILKDDKGLDRALFTVYEELDDDYAILLYLALDRNSPELSKFLSLLDIINTFKKVDKDFWEKYNSENSLLKEYGGFENFLLEEIEDRLANKIGKYSYNNDELKLFGRNINT
ncbi:MAG: hypothetical protein DRP72_02045, partial [Candidatus Omnitrophota bacterium]